MANEDDKLTHDERRELYGPMYEFAVHVHANVLGHIGLLKDCPDLTCLKAMSALESLDV